MPAKTEHEKVAEAMAAQRDSLNALAKVAETVAQETSDVSEQFGDDDVSPETREAWKGLILRQKRTSVRRKNRATVADALSNPETLARIIPADALLPMPE